MWLAVAFIVFAGAALLSSPRRQGAAFGEEVPAPLAKVIDTLTGKLARRGLTPDGYRYEARAVTFLYSDAGAAAKAEDLLPMSLEVDAKMIKFTARTA